MSNSNKGYGIHAIALSPDQRFIVGGGSNTANQDGSIRVWDFNTGDLLRSDKWDHYELNSILVTPDSRSVVVSGREDHSFNLGFHYVYVGDPENGQYRCIKSWPHGSLRLALTQDKKYVQFDDYIWNWQTGHYPQLRDKTVYPDLKPSWSKFKNKRINLKPIQNKISKLINPTHTPIYDIDTFVRIHGFNPGDSDRRAFSPVVFMSDGLHMLSQKDNALTMWDTQTGNLVRSFSSCTGFIFSIILTDDNQYAVVNLISNIRVINLQTGKLKLQIIPEKL